MEAPGEPPSARHQPERHARPQRAARAVARPPERQSRQDRHRPHDTAFGTDGLRDRAAARGGGAADEADAGARQGRAAIRADGPRGRRRLLYRPEDRAAKRRVVLIDFLGNLRSMLQESYRYPAPRGTVEFVRAGIQRMRDRLHPGAGPADRRARHCDAFRSLELGGNRRSAAPRSWKNGAITTSAPTSSRCAAFRSICRTTRRPPAAPNWSSGRPGNAERFRLFLHRRLRRRRRCAQRPALQRADRQCRRARLDAGARRRRAPGAGHRGRIARHPRESAQRTGQGRQPSVDGTRGMGRRG